MKRNGTGSKDSVLNFLYLGIKMDEVKLIKLTKNSDESILFEYELLYDSALDALNKIKNKRNPAIKFLAHIDDNIIKLQDEVLNHSYILSPFRYFTVYDPKERHIRSLAIRDRVVQRMIYNLILPVFEPFFIKDTYACLKNKGGDKARVRLSYFINKYSENENGWYLKLDIKKYFYSIDTQILYDLYLKPNLPEWIISYLELFVPYGQVGVPIGDLLCQVYANLYLSKFDHYCKTVLGIKHYVRYMDDIVILADNKRDLIIYYKLAKDYLENLLHLTLNPKSHINKISNGIPFIGYNFHYDCIYAKVKKVKRMKNAIYGYNEGKVGIDKLNAGINSRKGVYLHAANKYDFKMCWNTILDINSKVDYYESDFNEKNKKKVA